MNFNGIIIGALALIVIGLGHPMVTKGYRIFGVKIWIAFLVCGLFSAAGSLIVTDNLVSVFLGFLAATFLWSIKETFGQRKKNNRP